ncbi:iron-siderophore ABC transporter substrate-binding protein [Streptomyces uncialis]|uniref:iron-siderophore ABC transporter substrate-binding protein n=1 Tax=Streptomyces uncialis TaxID=1048205 RepID=UPI00386F0C2F|nr:iron-siderophore ABC transporter substrate-binding protein [Streptomyces uncialis]
MPPLRKRLSTRFAAVAAGTALLAGAAAGCGSPDQDSEDSGSTGRSGAVEKGAFPVTIEHKYGSTKIAEEPERIVTVGLTDQDAVLALGKVPVGTTEWLTSGYKGNIGPWAEDELGSAKPPAVLKDTGTGPQTEKIAALDPDVILALYAGLTKDQYRTLSKIAPVVVQPQGYNDYGLPWRQQTEAIGTALGQPAKARKLVAATEKHISDAGAANPAFKGRTAVMATPYQGMFVFGPEDPRTRLLASLGFTQPDGLKEVVGDEFGANISKERTDLVDTDALVWTVPDLKKDAAKLHANKLYNGLDVVKEGREVFVQDGTPYGDAVSFVTVLSLPYTTDRLVPQLKAAVDGEPGTKVGGPES